MAKKNYYKQALALMTELNKKYPNYSLGRHISTALSDYGDFWGITDREFCFAIEKYISELALEADNLAPQEYVDMVVRQTEKMFSSDSPLIEEDEEEEDY